MIRVILLFACSIAFVSLNAQNLLSGRYSADQLQELLIQRSEWTPFPKFDDRAGWAKADEKTMRAILAKAEQFIDYEWPYIPATRSLLIDRTGDRDQYQSVSFQKRTVLGTMLLAEIHENKGRFIDPIINGVWSICEESFWGVPAHLPKTKEYSGLMDTSNPFVDLFAAETAAMLSWVDYFLGDKFDAVSPQIRKRIYNETKYRIFDPLMTKHHGWMGSPEDRRRPNNWNPWICSNWLNAILLLENDQAKRAETVTRILKVLDNFLNPYPQDGGCDEGPGYWGAAAASLYDNLALLNLATPGSFDYAFKDEKVRNMGKFIYRAQIGEVYFLNFSDASPKPRMSANMIYRFGKDIGDPDMMRFGAFYREEPRGEISRFHFFRNLFGAFIEQEFQNAQQGLPLPQDVWLPDLQVMIARDKAGSSQGFFVGAKGGNNDESHNHNDIGNFMVYYDGLPVLIDIGSGTYTRRTFSNERYDIWFNRSDYHNVPTIKGMTQSAGGEFQARNVDYSKSGSYARISMDIAPSYPAEAGVESWKRIIRLNRGKNVQISDEARLTSEGEIVQHLMTCYPAEVTAPGQLIIHYKGKDGQSRDFVVTYDAKKLEARVEKIELGLPEDKGIKNNWGDNIHRINFISLSNNVSQSYSLNIAAQKARR